MATYEEVLKKKREMLEQLKADYEAKRRDGFTVGEIIEFILATARAIVEIVEEAEGLSGPEKKKLVVDNIRRFYKDINPNLPGIPEFVENMLEGLFLEFLLPVVIDFIIKTYNEKNVFVHGN